MNANDIIYLAKAGFSRQEIASIMQMTGNTPGPVIQNAQTVAPTPVAPTPVAPAAPAAPAPVAPATVAPAPVAPAQQAPQQLDFFNQLLGKIDGLTTTMQAQAIANSQQPAQPSEQDILAEIICPPVRKE